VGAKLNIASVTVIGLTKHDAIALSAGGHQLSQLQAYREEHCELMNGALPIAQVRVPTRSGAGAMAVAPQVPESIRPAAWASEMGNRHVGSAAAMHRRRPEWVMSAVSGAP
jgi:hypothetical protein